MKPEISVLMSVYNTNCKYLCEAIDSILCQTFKDFEFIIIDDGSNHENKELLSKYCHKDTRIMVITNEHNMGLTKSLNIGLNLARGKYVARMDADDISRPERLEKQYMFMNNNADVIVSGGLVKSIGNKKKTLAPVEETDIMRMRMLFYNCIFAHPTAFINMSKLNKIGVRYDEKIKKAQDYMFWANCLSCGRIALLPDIILDYRMHNEQTTMANSSEQEKSAIYVQSYLLKRYLNINLDEQDLQIHYSMAKGMINTSISNITKHISMLEMANKKMKSFDEKQFNRECSYIWIMMSLKALKHHDCRGILSRKFLVAFFNYRNWEYYRRHFKMA